MNYEDALEYIHSLRWMSKKLGLTKTREILSLLGNPEKKLKYVHIVGTNGKGSTAAFIAEILREAGYKTGLFTSPFIMRFNERIMVSTKGEGDSLYGFKEIPDEELARLTDIVKEAVDKMAEPPSEFEVVTAIGFLYYVQENCDIVVLEAGMGGEADSTNVIPAPLATVFTNIGFDHMQYLGNTITEIARTKSGVVKHGSTAVFYGENEEAYKEIKAKCDEEEVELILPDFSKLVTKENSLFGQTFSYKDLVGIKLSLIGQYQQRNAAVATEAVKILIKSGFNISDDAIKQGLLHTNWFARLERISEDPLVFVDGSHNPQGMRATVDAVKNGIKDSDSKFDRIVCVFGVMADKDHKAILEILSEIADTIVCVQPEYNRAMAHKDLFDEALSVCKDKNINIIDGNFVPEGIDRALSLCTKNSLMLCLGSLYMASEVRDHFKKH